MRTLTFIAAFAIAAPAFAQEPAPEEKPAAPSEAPAKKAADAAAPELAPLPEPEPGSEQADILRNQPGGRLIPDPVAVPGAKRPGNPERVPGKSTLRPPVTSGELERRIRYREARNRAEADPKLVAIWDESRTVNTDFAKRALLKDYYKGLYAKMLKLDQSIAPLVELRRRVALRRLDQSRVDPTERMEDDGRVRFE